MHQPDVEQSSSLLESDLDYPSIHAPNGAIEQFAFLYALDFSLVDSHEQTDGLPTFHLVYEHADRAIRITVCQAWDRGHSDRIINVYTTPDKDWWGYEYVGIDFWPLWKIIEWYGHKHVEARLNYTDLSSVYQDWRLKAERLSNYLPRFLRDIEKRPLLERRIRQLEDWYSETQKAHRELSRALAKAQAREKDNRSRQNDRQRSFDSFLRLLIKFCAGGDENAELNGTARRDISRLRETVSRLADEIEWIEKRITKLRVER